MYRFQYRNEVCLTLYLVLCLHLRDEGPDCCLGPNVVSLDNGWDGVTSYKNLEHLHQGKLDYRSHRIIFSTLGMKDTELEAQNSNEIFKY